MNNTRGETVIKLTIVENLIFLKFRGAEKYIYSIPKNEKHKKREPTGSLS